MIENLPNSKLVKSFHIKLYLRLYEIPLSLSWPLRYLLCVVYGVHSVSFVVPLISKYNAHDIAY